VLGVLVMYHGQDDATDGHPLIRMTFLDGVGSGLTGAGIEFELGHKAFIKAILSKCS